MNRVIKSPKTKNSKLSEIKQIDGKVVEDQTVKPTTMDQVWGNTGISKYKTLDANEYKKMIDDLARADLYNHAVSVGLVPNDDIPRLKRNLMAEFGRHVNDYKPRPVANKNSAKVSPEVQKILDEGK